MILWRANGYITYLWCIYWRVYTWEGGFLHGVNLLCEVSGYIVVIHVVCDYTSHRFLAVLFSFIYVYHRMPLMMLPPPLQRLCRAMFESLSHGVEKRKDQEIKPPTYTQL